jgi:membrane dipeptidase
MTQPVIFDGHNDVLLRLFQAGGKSAVQTFSDGTAGHIDLPKARAGNFAGGFFAIFVPSGSDLDDDLHQMTMDRYDLPLPAPVEMEPALSVTLAQVAILLELERRNALVICTNVEAIRTAINSGKMAAIMHMEGAEAIDPDFNNLDALYAVGLRSLGPVWSRPNRFGHGVPFRYPSNGDIGPGLTPDGRRLIDYCNQKRIMIDLSHLNEAGFWDVAARSSQPLVATHSNCYALSPHARNLSDKQLFAIAETGGVVGLNFAVSFLRADGKMLGDVGLEVMLRHLDHLLSILGDEGVAFGSDFDGAVVPDEIGDVSGLGKLVNAMQTHGYGAPLINKLCGGNWLNILDKTWSMEPNYTNNDK